MKLHKLTSAAKIMGLPISAIRTLVSDRKIAVTKVGQRYYISEQAIEDYTEANTLKPVGAKK